jgi:integrase
MTAMAEVRKRGRNWYYRYIGPDGRRLERKGCPDKRVTEGLAAQAEAEAAKVRAGLVDPKAEAYRRHEARPLAEHLSEWRAGMLAKGRKAKHAALYHNRVAQLLSLAKAVRLCDLQPSRIQTALGTLQDEGLSAQTANHYRAAVRAFVRWARADGRLRDDPMAGVTGYNAPGDRRLVRRPLDDDELRRLIDSARTAPPWRGMTGPDRTMLYTIGAATGFRRSELASLRSDSFRLDANPPTIVCEAAYTKNGQQAEQPIPNALADALRPWVASRAPGRPVFDPLPEKTGQMLKTDLRRAGIDPVDGDGRVVDMHSLRHGYITALAKAGVPVKVLQTLARHSDPRLTLNIYTHLSVFDISGALGALPDLTPSLPDPAAMTATGTDGGHIPNRFAPHLPHAGDGSGRNLTVADVIEGSEQQGSMGPEPLENKGSDASGEVLTVAGGQRRRRESNPLPRFCRPLPGRLAPAPRGDVLAGN